MQGLARFADEARPLAPGFRDHINGIAVAGTTPCAPADPFEPA